LLIYAVPGASENPGPAPAGVIEDWLDYTAAIKEAGGLVAAEQLTWPDTATPIRLAEGGRRGAAAAVARPKEEPLRFYPAGHRRPRGGGGRGGQDAHHGVGQRGGAAGRGRHALADSAEVAATAALERAFREEWTTVVAGLSRRLGDLQAAEDATAEAFTAAATAWRRGGGPPHPRASLTLTPWPEARGPLRRGRAVAQPGLCPAALPGP